MITNINYNHLYYFWQVSKHGSIAAASKILNLTPQTVSSQITNLEQRLGKPLFIRQGRGLQLTEFGHVTQQYTNDMFAIAHEWLETTQGDTTQYSRTLKVGIYKEYDESSLGGEAAAGVAWAYKHFGLNLEYNYAKNSDFDSGGVMFGAQLRF